MTVPSFKLDAMSFYWRMSKEPFASAGGIPHFLPFEFDFNPTFDLVVQKHNPAIDDALHRAYLQAENVGYLQDGHALAASYGGDFLAFIGASAASGGRVLEIGCGGGYILQRLREMGFAVRGIDPSPVAVAKGRECGVEIVEAFYPHEGMEESCDVIIHYDVLEHVYDPLAFLSAHHRQLSPNGITIFAVPDCSESIERGDLSMVIHEHVNYFDMSSLRRVVECAGFAVERIERAKHGGVLFCAARRSGAQRSGTAAIGGAKYQDFVDRVERSVKAFRRISAAANGEFGIYIPLRAVPYLAAIGRRNGLRFFDDDPGCHRKYFAGYEASVENFNDFVASPPKHLFIASLAFADRIKAKIRDRLGDAVEITTLRELFSDRTSA